MLCKAVLARRLMQAFLSHPPTQWIQFRCHYMYMRKSVAQDLLCMAYEQDRKTDMHIRHELQQAACTSALLLRSPARELRPTLHCAGPTRQGDDTTCPELQKTGPEDTEKSDPSGWSGSPCAVLRVVSGAPVALLAHLVLDKPVRVCQRGTGLSAVEFGPLGCCKGARWSPTCLFTFGAGCL